MGAVKRTHPEARKRQQYKKDIMKLKGDFDDVFGKGEFNKLITNTFNAVLEMTKMVVNEYERVFGGRHEVD